MSIDTGEVGNIAWLARLATSGEELEEYRQDLDNILALVNKMNTVATGDMPPLAHPLDLSARLRADEVTEPDQRKKFQAIAPETADGYYLVPRVIE
ncbi:MAG: Asp-tRNA(Asn)/Glu-tRNA(Gln) amidotransferase subunit GatC [Gammaproteobacteria bacterium]